MKEKQKDSPPFLGKYPTQKTGIPYRAVKLISSPYFQEKD